MPTLSTRPCTALLALTGLPSLLFAADTVNGVPVEVLARTTVVARDGGTTTFVRIRPPARPTQAVIAPEPTAEPSAAALAEEARLAAKAYVDWQPTVLVHLGSPLVSELRFPLGGREVRVWTNVDFRALAPVSQWESADTVYGWFPTISELGREDGGTRPPDLGLTPGPAEYIVEATPAELAAHEADLAPLDSLLAYHELHREALIAEQARRAALDAERIRQAALPPPKPKDTTIYFWKNENPAPSP